MGLGETSLRVKCVWLNGRNEMKVTRAQVVVLAGPSGAGKSRLAERLGLPVLRLDDFYKDGDDPTLPRIGAGANTGIVDWDHPDSWSHADAMKAVRDLCHSGTTEVPIYEIALNGRTGARRRRPRRPHPLRRRGHLRPRDRRGLA